MSNLPKIVAGYHASQASLHALAAAKDLAEQMKAEIHVVHAIDLSDYPIDPDRSDWEEKGRFGFQRGVMVGSSDQSGLPA